MSESTSEEKSLPPSTKKLTDRRKKGEIARHRELVTAVVTVTAFSVLAIQAPAVFSQFEGIVDRAGDVAASGSFGDALAVIAPQLGLVTVELLGPLAIMMVAGVLVSNVVVNGGLVMSLDPVMPKLERLDPIAGLKKLVGLRSWIELSKTLAKLTLVLATAILLLRGAMSALVEQPTCGLGCAAPMLGALVEPLLIAACLGFLLTATLDIGVQRWLFRRDMRMTRTEQKRERKEQDGDPLMKRRAKREQRASGQPRMRAGMRHATFVVRSGTTCCAMRFAHPDAQVPIMVARGRDETALQLVDEARRHNVPVVYDPGLAKMLDEQLKVGMMITKAMFPPVIACMREARVL